MPPRWQFRTALKPLHAAACVLTLIAAWACPQRADAQWMFGRSNVLDMSAAIDLLAAARVPVPPAVFSAAYSAYLDEIERVYVQTDAELARIREQGRLDWDAYLGVRDSTRVAEITDKGRKEGDRLRDEFLERLKQSVPEHAAKFDAIRTLIKIEIHASNIGDIGQYLRPPRSNLPFGVRQVWGDGSMLPQVRMTEEQRATMWELLQVNADGRLRSLEAMTKDAEEQALELARRAEKAGFAGKSRSKLRAEMQDAWNAMYRNGQSNDNREEYDRLQAQQRLLYDVERGERDQRNNDTRTEAVKQQWNAYKAMEDRLPKSVKNRIADSWMPRLFWRSYMFSLEGPDRSWLEGPSDVIRNLLRLKQLTDEQRTTLRTMGAKLLGEAREGMRKGAEKAVASGQTSFEDALTGEQMQERFREIGKALGLKEMQVGPDQQMRFPKGELLDQISGEDAEEFGEVQPQTKWEQIMGRRYVVQNAVPVPPPDGRAKELCELLNVGPDLSPIVEVMVAEAKDRWDQQVKPLIEKCEPKWTEEMSGDDAQEAWRREIDRAFQTRTQAFARAAEADQVLFEGLQAALGNKADATLLAIASLASRTEASIIPEVSEGEHPLDLPRAIVEAPVTPASRKVIAGEFAASVEQWKQLAQRVLAAQIARRHLDYTGERWRTRYEPTNAELAKHVADVDEAVKRARSAWATAEGELMQRLSDAVPAAEAEAWKSYVNSLKWPSLYPELTDVRRQATRALGMATQDAELTARVSEILGTAQQHINRTGDVAVSITKSFGEIKQDPEGWNPEMHALSWRVGPLISFAGWRRVLAGEAIRAALPAECAARLPGRSIFDALQPNGASEAATAAVPTSASQP